MGSIEYYKSHLIAKEYIQQEGINFLETYSLIAKTINIRSLLILTICYGWHLEQLDINNVLLHGDLYENVFSPSLPYNKDPNS